MRRFRPGLRNRGVTEQQWRIVRALAHAGPMEVTALAEATFLLRAQPVAHPAGLEARGLISRRQLDSDLRRSGGEPGAEGTAAHRDARSGFRGDL